MEKFLATPMGTLLFIMLVVVSLGIAFAVVAKVIFLMFSGHSRNTDQESVFSRSVSSPKNMNDLLEQYAGGSRQLKLIHGEYNIPFFIIFAILFTIIFIFYI